MLLFFLFFFLSSSDRTGRKFFVSSPANLAGGGDHPNFFNVWKKMYIKEVMYLITDNGKETLKLEKRIINKYDKALAVLVVNAGGLNYT